MSCGCDNKSPLYTKIGLKMVFEFLTALLLMLTTVTFFGSEIHLFNTEALAATVDRQYGDINWDGKIDSRDTCMILEHISASEVPANKASHPDWILTGDDYKAADVNCDGIVDSRDTQRLLEYIAASTVEKIHAKYPEWYNYLRRWFSVSYPDDGLYVIVSALNNSKAVDLCNGLTSNGTNIQLYDKNGTHAQLFSLKRSGRYYTIQSVVCNRGLDVAGGIAKSGTNVQLYDLNSTDAQKWKFDSAGNGYYYIRSKLGFTLDVEGANTANWTNIGISDLNNTNSQKFKLISVGNGSTMYALSKVALKKNPNNETVLATVPQGGIVYSFCTYESWSMVKYNGQAGYISTDKLGKNPPVSNVNVTGISLNKSNASVKAGSTVALKATISPSNATNKSVTWTSSNKKVATVSGGTVKGIAAGTATITARSNNGKTATCKITVTTNTTISAKRENIVKYMRSMATVEWTPKTTFTHWSGGRKWTAGTLYKGIPYSQSNRNTTLEAFKKKMSGKTYVGPAKQKTYMGSDCSSSVSMAWRKVDTSFKIRNTETLLPGSSKIVKVGIYIYSSKNGGTKANCNKNGFEKMSKAYSNLKPGDAVVRRNGDSGHVMLVSSVSSGKIKVIEQTTFSGNSTWRVDRTYTYSDLYNQGYLPISLKGLQ